MASEPGTEIDPNEDAAKAEARARRLANLRPPWQSGEVANPKGKNGRTQHEEFVQWMDEVEEGEKVSRIGKVWGATFRNSLKPAGGLDRKTLIEQYQGKAKQRVDVSNEDESLFPALLRVIAGKPAEEAPKDE